MRLACAWPLLIGLSTLERLASAPDWLDPARSVKISRASVYGLVARSLVTVWSGRLLARQARDLTGRIHL
jgi:farnesyl-diphosphate farnesyltransferase